LRHKNVSNPPEMTHYSQFSVVTCQVCSRCGFLWLYFLSFKIFLESVSCFSYCGIELFKFSRNTIWIYRRRANQFRIYRDL
jgi:hypothetical protein